MPVDEYTSNLRSVIEHIQGAGAEHILLLTPPPLHEPARVKFNQAARMLLQRMLPSSPSAVAL